MTTPTTPEDPTSAATDRARELQARVDTLLHDPRRDSRWWWIRQIAWRRLDQAGEALRELTSRRRDELIDEAIARVDATTDHGTFWWRRPDPGVVLADMASHLPSLPLPTPVHVLNRLYADRPLNVNHEDRRLLEAQFDTWDPVTQEQVRELLRGWSFLTTPHANRVWHDGPTTHAMRDFLASDAAILPRPVTVWRGEKPNEHAPNFADTTWKARPGTVLHRSDRPLSASAVPAGAARPEFCGVHPLDSGPRGDGRRDDNGWILKITTRRALYAGDRERLLGVADGNAGWELEVLILAPRLLVTDMYETRIVKGVGRESRVLVIECDCA